MALIENGNGHALVPVSEHDAALTYKVGTNAATLCGDIVKATAQSIQGRKYVKVEGWLAIASAHGCLVSIREVRNIEGGVCAVAELRRISDQALLATAEGFVGDDESMWAKRPMFARRAMAQTRASSRVCRSAFAHVVVLIDKNLGTTPAEEMQGAIEAEQVQVIGGTVHTVAPEDQHMIRKDAVNAETGEVKSQYRIDKEKECVKWVDASLQTFKLSGQTTDSLDTFWKSNIKRIDWMEENMPADHERLLTGFDAARDTATQRAA